jgi:hypothetical protein
MLLVALVAVLLLVLSTVIHYEVLRGMSFALPRLGMPGRTKLVLVILGAFFAHSLEMVLYAISFYLLAGHMDLGSLGSAVPTIHRSRPACTSRPRPTPRWATATWSLRVRCACWPAWRP